MVNYQPLKNNTQFTQDNANNTYQQQHHQLASDSSSSSIHNNIYHNNSSSSIYLPHQQQQSPSHLHSTNPTSNLLPNSQPIHLPSNIPHHHYHHPQQHQHSHSLPNHNSFYSAPPPPPPPPPASHSDYSTHSPYSSDDASSSTRLHSYNPSKVHHKNQNFQTPPPTNSNIQYMRQFSHYLNPNFSVNLKFTKDLNLILQNWSPQEIKDSRRLVKFELIDDSQGNIDGRQIIDFYPISSIDYDNSKPVISCIYWQQQNRFICTSVDIILLLEYLVHQSFGIEEKNRIRRNLQSLKPTTVSRSNKDDREFFNLIMSMENPRPRNIEKDLKVFNWKDLNKAISKVMSKYYVVPSSTSSTTIPSSTSPVRSYSSNWPSSQPANSPNIPPSNHVPLPPTRSIINPPPPTTNSISNPVSLDKNTLSSKSGSLPILPPLSTHTQHPLPPPNYASPLASNTKLVPHEKDRKSQPLINNSQPSQFKYTPSYFFPSNQVNNVYNGAYNSHEYNQGQPKFDNDNDDNGNGYSRNNSDGNGNYKNNHYYHHNSYNGSFPLPPPKAPFPQHPLPPNNLNNSILSKSSSSTPPDSLQNDSSSSNEIDSRKLNSFNSSSSSMQNVNSQNFKSQLNKNNQQQQYFDSSNNVNSSSSSPSPGKQEQQKLNGKKHRRHMRAPKQTTNDVDNTKNDPKIDNNNVADDDATTSESTSDEVVSSTSSKDSSRTNGKSNNNSGSESLSSKDSNNSYLSLNRESGNSSSLSSRSNSLAGYASNKVNSQTNLNPNKSQLKQLVEVSNSPSSEFVYENDGDDDEEDEDEDASMEDADSMDIDNIKGKQYKSIPQPKLPPISHLLKPEFKMSNVQLPPLSDTNVPKEKLPSIQKVEKWKDF